MPKTQRTDKEIITEVQELSDTTKVGEKSRYRNKLTDKQIMPTPGQIALGQTRVDKGVSTIFINPIAGKTPAEVDPRTREEVVFHEALHTVDLTPEAFMEAFGEQTNKSLMQLAQEYNEGADQVRTRFLIQRGQDFRYSKQPGDVATQEEKKTIEFGMKRLEQINK